MLISIEVKRCVEVFPNTFDLRCKLDHKQFRLSLDEAKEFRRQLNIKIADADLLEEHHKRAARNG